VREKILANLAGIRAGLLLQLTIRADPRRGSPRRASFSRLGPVGGDHAAASVDLITMVYWKIPKKKPKTHAYLTIASLDYCLIATALLRILVNTAKLANQCTLERFLSILVVSCNFFSR
jgi:hypothetical protein